LTLFLAVVAVKQMVPVQPPSVAWVTPVSALPRQPAPPTQALAGLMNGVPVPLSLRRPPAKLQVQLQMQMQVLRRRPVLLALPLPALLAQPGSFDSPWTAARHFYYHTTTPQQR